MACACRSAAYLECVKCGQVFCVAPTAVSLDRSRVFCEEGCDGELRQAEGSGTGGCVRAHVFWNMEAKRNWVRRCE